MKMVLMISEEVSRTYRELIIRTASHYDSHVHQLMGIYTGICTLYIVEQFAIGINTLAKRFSNISLWCLVRFYRTRRLLQTQDGNYTWQSQRVWKAWSKASHKTIKKKTVDNYEEFTNKWKRVSSKNKKSIDETIGLQLYDGAW